MNSPDSLEQNPLFHRILCPVCSGGDLASTLLIAYGDLKKKKYADYSAIGISRETLLNVDRCNSCGFVFANPRIKPEHYSRIYNESKALMYQEAAPDNLASLERGPLTRRLIALGPLLGLIRLHEGITKPYFLDIGAGFGHSLSLAHAFGLEGFGIEIDEQRIAHCSRLGLNVSTITELDNQHPSVKFDLMVAQSVIEHVADLQWFGELIKRKAKPGCVRYVNGLTPDIIDIERRRGEYTNAHFVEHINYFPIHTVDKFMRERAFVPIDRTVVTLNGRAVIAPKLAHWIVKGFKRLRRQGSFGRYYRYAP